MKHGTAFVFGKGYTDYEFSPEHPLQPIRLQLTYELAKNYGLFDQAGAKLVEPRMASDDELLLVHEKPYLEMVRSLSETGIPAFGGIRFGLGISDNPVFKGMHEASALIAGGSILAAELVISGEVEHALNIGGGLHHAMANRASGFCIYNDPAVAIASIRQKHDLRMVYVDIDAHHGDGVQWMFYDSPDVLTISLHESGRYLFPGTGFVREIGEGTGEGFSVNIPLEPFTFDEPYLFAFDQVVVPLVRAYRPELLVTQCGCDSHFSDPLTQMALTTHAFSALYKRMHSLAHEVCEGKWVALGGGGYQAVAVVPRAWTMLFAEALGVDLPEEIPAGWQESCRLKAGRPCPSRLSDEERGSDFERPDVWQRTREIVAEVKKKVFPYHGLPV